MKNLICLLFIVCFINSIYAQLSLTHTKKAVWEYNDTLGRYAWCTQELLLAEAPRYNNINTGASSNFITVYSWKYYYKSPITGEILRTSEYTICQTEDCNVLYLPITAYNVRVRVAIVDPNTKDPINNPRVILFNYKWDDDF